MGLPYANIKSMLHMDGANLSTTFVDEQGRAWTAAGGAKISTAQFKFGGASGLFGGASDYITTPDSADFDLGNGNFTIDNWIYIINMGTDYIAVQGSSAAAGTSFWWGFLSTGELSGRIISGTTSYTATSAAGLITTGSFIHVAMVRNGNLLSIYKMGVSVGTANVTGVTANTSTAVLTVGRQGTTAAGYIDGYLDEFRFVVGEAMWTADFTPPTAPYYTVGGGGPIFQTDNMVGSFYKKPERSKMSGLFRPNRKIFIPSLSQIKQYA